MPKLYVGDKQVKDIYRGSQRVKKIYKGDKLIYKFFKGLFIKITPITETQFKLYISKDLINWAETLVINTTDKYHDPYYTFNSDMIVICEERAQAGTETKKFWYSYDGINWNTYQVANMEKTIDLVCLNNKFFIFPGNGVYNYIYQSIDGINWVKKYLGDYQANLDSACVYDNIHNNLVVKGAHQVGNIYYYGCFIISEDFSNIDFVGDTNYQTASFVKLLMFDNKIYRNYYNSTTYFNYIEYSSDGGYNWSRAPIEIPGSTSINITIAKNKLYVIYYNNNNLYTILESPDGRLFNSKLENCSRADCLMSDDDYLYIQLYDDNTDKKNLYKGRNLDELELYQTDFYYLYRLWRQEDFNT